MPDFVERQIYKNVFNLLIGLLNKSLSSSSIKFLGHELTFVITPEKPEENKPEEKIESGNKLEINILDTNKGEKFDQTSEKKKKKKKHKSIDISDIIGTELHHIIKEARHNPEITEPK